MKSLAGDNPGLSEFMMNATDGKKYDLKRDGDLDNMDRNFHHRGSIFRIEADGTKILASSKDFGNYRAGLIAGSKGLSWLETRIGFDGPEILKSKSFKTEGLQSVIPQRLGHQVGIELFRKKC